MNDTTETPAVAGDVEPMLDVSHLVGCTGHDTINQGTCMLEYLAELRSEYGGSSPPSGDEGRNVLYGCWLIDLTIVAMIRHGLAQNERDWSERLQRAKEATQQTLVRADG